MGSKFKIDVQWEDSDVGFGDEEAWASEDADENQAFSQLLSDESDDEAGQNWRTGDQVEVTVAHIGSGDDVICELGVKGCATISKQELQDPESGELTVMPGDRVKAYVVSQGEAGIVLSRSLSQKLVRENALEDAFARGTPVRGKITGSNKGGFDVQLLGKKAFCPISQVDASYVEDPQPFVGRDLDFLITSLKGRDIVISRRRLLERQQADAFQEVKKLQAGDPNLSCTITEIKPAGLVVDVLGANGFIPISVACWGRVDHLGEVYKVGDKVDAKIIEINEADRRLVLSVKKAQRDPWEHALTKYPSESTISGKVVRIEKFGAFVELEPGIDGLVHVSEMSWMDRVHHPSDVVQLGDQVVVRVIRVDAADRRMSLSLKSLDEDPWLGAGKRFPAKSRHSCPVESLSGHGAIVRLAPGIASKIPLRQLKAAFAEGYRKKSAPPAKLDVIVVECEPAARRVEVRLACLESDDENQQLDLQSFNLEASRSSGSMGALGQALSNSLKGRPGRQKN